ncbi:winged-helix domain-containing protein [Paenibacillus sp. N1-5-1-14]|uniref:winged helix-turn-helix transcriptional regulator n=1 Tax=Paenibacillus radicibacter TaxID=2972488 RepID=UPI002158B124|nr:winged-helix domain-containing protein [Paenibacillus radicibacter]MCR8642638.1 winged-helix domain-containing protein [Paenibacillus radicibacter]
MSTNEKLMTSSNRIPSSFPEGAVCKSTNRIVLISPYPAGLQELVGILSEHCFDVMVFHHIKDDLLAMLKIDVLVLDQSHAGIEMDSSEWNIPTIHLVSRVPDPVEHSDQHRYIQWPADRKAVREAVELLIVENRLASPAQSNVQVSASLGQVVFKDLMLDSRKMIVSRGEVRIDLTRIEFDLLKVLLEADGAALSRQAMMDAVWGSQYFGGSNIVDVHVKSLRQKLGDSPKASKYITTVRGIGYRLAD